MSGISLDGVPCPVCDLMTLDPYLGDQGRNGVRCGNCDLLLTEDDLRRWIGLVAAHAAEEGAE